MNVTEYRLLKMKEDRKHKAEIWRRSRIARKRLETPRIMGFTFKGENPIEKVESVKLGVISVFVLPTGCKGHTRSVRGTTEFLSWPLQGIGNFGVFQPPCMIKTSFAIYCLSVESVRVWLRRKWRRIIYSSP